MDTPKSQDLQDFQNKLLEACRTYDNATVLKLAICRLMFDPKEVQAEIDQKIEDYLHKLDSKEIDLDWLSDSMSKDISDEISDSLDSDQISDDDDSVDATILDDKNDDDEVQDGDNDDIVHDTDNQMQSVFAEQMQTYEKIYSNILKFGNFIKSQFDDEDDETEPEQVTDVTEVPMTDDKIDESENTEEQIESLKEIISSLENEIAEQKVKIDTLENSLMEKNDNAEKVENLENQIDAFKEQVECLKDNIRWLFDQKEASNDKLEKSNLIIADQKSKIDTLQDDCEDLKHKLDFFANGAKHFTSLYVEEKAKTKMIEKDLKSAQDKIAEQEIDINKFKEDFAFIEDLIKNIDVLNVCQR